MSNWFVTSDGTLAIDLDDVLMASAAPEGHEGPGGWLTGHTGRLEIARRETAVEVVEALRGLVRPTAEVEVEVEKRCNNCDGWNDEVCTGCYSPDFGFTHWRPREAKP